MPFDGTLQELRERALDAVITEITERGPVKYPNKNGTHGHGDWPAYKSWATRQATSEHVVDWIMHFSAYPKPDEAWLMDPTDLTEDEA
jgi:hypothetical protein